MCVFIINIYHWIDKYNQAAQNKPTILVKANFSIYNLINYYNIQKDKILILVMLCIYFRSVSVVYTRN